MTVIYAHPFEEELENRTTEPLFFTLLLDLSKVANTLLALAMFLTLSHSGRSWLLLCKVLWREAARHFVIDRQASKFWQWVW